MQKGRCGHSGGPPRVSLFATGARLLTVVRLYLVAVSALATNTFWSCADEYVRSSRPLDFRSSLSFAATAPESPEACPLGSRNRSSDDRYSGLRSIWPDSMAFCETS